jgi:hypothetical protein
MVTVPGYKDPVEFPDSMSNEDIEKVLQKQRGSFPEPKGEVSRMAGERLKHLNPDADASQPSAVGQTLNKATGGLYGAVEKNIPMAAGMLATAGTSAGPLAAGAAFASTKGLAEKALGSDKSPRQAASDFVWDTVLVAAPDKLLKTAAKIGGPVFEKFVLSSAMKTQKGENLLKTADNAAHDAVTKSPEVVGRTGDITAAYRKFVDYVDSLPHGEGATEKAYGTLQGAAKKLYDVASADIGAVDAATGLPKPAAQPLDALIRYESKWMQEAYNAAEGGATGKSENAAAEAMKTFANEVRGVITKELPPKARQMFEYAKGLTSARYEASATQAIAKNITGGFVRGILKDAYDLTGGPLVEKFSPLVLEQMLGSGPGLSLLKGLTSRASNNPVALSGAIKQGSKNLVQFIPVEIKDAIQREAKKALDAAPTMGSVVNQNQEGRTP